jgi:hypothetical protein
MFLAAALPPVIDSLVRDGGPIYRETDLSRFIAEPWNGISSLAFMIPVFYWMFRLSGQYRKYVFIIGCMPLLILGSLGSTLFHAFRASYVLLLMDFLPIIILTLCISIYLWYHVLKDAWMVSDIVLISFIVRFPLFQELDRNQAINASYFITGCMMFIPAIIYMYRTKFVYAGYLFTAVAFFLLALLFRYTDTKYAISFLPMGTHWLWHIFCGIGIMPLSFYLVKMVDLKASKTTRSVPFLSG